jgi:protease-4
MTEYNPVRRRRRRRRLVFIILLLLVGFVLGRTFLWGPAVEDGSYVLLELAGDYPEKPSENLFGRFVSGQPVALLQLLRLIEEAADDERIAGMVVRIRTLEIGWAKAQDIRDSLLEFRDKGKPIVAYLEHEFAGGTLEYYVASAAEKVYLPPAASIPLTGLLAQYVFLGGVWEKLDIEMEVEQIGAYKSAGDMIKRKSMSPQHREMANSLLDSIFEQLVSGIAEGRGLEATAVRMAIDQAPVTTAELENLGLSDGVKFLSDLQADLLAPGREFLDAEDYRESVRSSRFESGRKEIALLYGVGPVNTGESRDGLIDSETMGSESMQDALREASEDDDTAAIVFRIDSPGGSALASDLIWKAVREARSKKPVIVSMSDVAASGGYYAAAGGTQILAQPGTITGSIGVVVSKPNIRGLLDRLGIGTETLSRGRHADLVSLTESLDPDGRERVLAAMEQVYDLFVTRVAEGRELEREQVDELGQGRVWTGAQAEANGLVDELGGLMAAIDLARAAAGIAEGEEVRLVVYPKPRTALERIFEYMGARLSSQAPRWWRRTRSILTAYEFPEGSILALMPQSVEIR